MFFVCGAVYMLGLIYKNNCYVGCNCMRYHLSAGSLNASFKLLTGISVGSRITEYKPRSASEIRKQQTYLKSKRKTKRNDSIRNKDIVKSVITARRLLKNTWRLTTGWTIE
jgi:hypothetical protein